MMITNSIIGQYGSSNLLSTDIHISIDYSKNTTFGLFEKKRLQQNYTHTPEKISGIKCYAIYSGGDVSVNLSFNKIANLQKLNEIGKLPENWNENGALKFSTEIIQKCKNIINSLQKQPEIFPTGANSIQMEYEKESGEYLEFNVYSEHTEVFEINALEQENEFSIFEDEIENVKELVRSFYAEDQ